MMPSKTINQDLPDEILVDIFGYLADSPNNIAACRTVCRKFDGCSRQLLVTRICFSKRRKDLERTYRILTHPNEKVRHGVTELHYDPSKYQAEHASDPEYYKEACELSERNFHNERAMRRDRGLLAMCRSVGAQVEPLAWDDADFSEMRWDDPLYQEMSAANYALASYTEHFNDQERIVEHNADQQFLRAIFRRLKNIRRIVFTDFRALAVEGESYERLCFRLFGSTLEPVGLSYCPGSYSEDLCLVLNVVAEMQHIRVRQLSIGGHPFESWALRPHDLRRALYLLPSGDGNVLPSQEVAAFPLDVTRAGSRFTKALVGLRELTLPVAVATDADPGTPIDFRRRMARSLGREVLRSCTQTLTRLSLTALDLLERSDKGSIVMTWQDGMECLDALLFPLKFASLKQLELWHWPLPAEDRCRAFLSSHAATLQELRLETCGFAGDAHGLARWAGAHLRLRKVRIRMFSIVENADDDVDGQWFDQPELETLWLGARAGSLLKGA